MKCEVCNSTIIVADRQCENCGTSIFDIAIKWQARAEKAEAELEAIKERIEAVEPSMISNIMATYLNGYDLSFATIEDEHACCEEILETIIKQIGGVK